MILFGLWRTWVLILYKIFFFTVLWIEKNIFCCEWPWIQVGVIKQGWQADMSTWARGKRVPQIPAWFEIKRWKRKKDKRSFVDDRNHIFKTHSSFWMASKMSGCILLLPVEQWSIFTPSDSPGSLFHSYRYLSVTCEANKKCTITGCRSTFILLAIWLQWKSCSFFFRNIESSNAAMTCLLSASSIKFTTSYLIPFKLPER